MTEVCPNCGQTPDLALPPSEDPPSDLKDYDRMCLIGTTRGERPGYRMYHGTTTEGN